MWVQVNTEDPTNVSAHHIAHCDYDSSVVDSVPDVTVAVYKLNQIISKQVPDLTLYNVIAYDGDWWYRVSVTSTLVTLVTTSTDKNSVLRTP